MKRALFFALLWLGVCSTICGGESGQYSIHNDALSLRLSDDAFLELRDVRTGVVWKLGQPEIVTVRGAEEPVKIRGQVEQTDSQLRFAAQDGTQFTLRLVADPPAVDYSFERSADCAGVLLLAHAIPLGAGADNYYAVPHRMGLMLRPEGDVPYVKEYRAYQTGGYSMAMFGAVQEGSALLLSWPDPYTNIAVNYVAQPAPQLSMSLRLTQSSHTVRVQPLGAGNYVQIAKAYRAIARERGYLTTLAEKLQHNPKIAKMFGAADFKPFAYMPLAPHTRWNTSDQWRVTLNFTFDECAQLAEHFCRDLEIDKAMLVLNGWINGGYDNKHPDILPAAAAIGGNEGLVACAARTQALGWIFGLHDNYADMYRDAPSWNESFLMRNADGSLRQGGVWAGGQCWLICSRKSVELASRPQNVPGVVQLCKPDLYFSDVIFATPLYECSAPEHPLTMVDDLAEKQKLCDYIRGVVGLFGSEEGREWGVAHADYFEGLMSHRTRWQTNNDTSIILPLFELVFADAIPMYTHQSDRPRPDMPAYILSHILYAEMPVYDFGDHCYYRDPVHDFQPRPGTDDQLLYARGGRFCLTDQFIKNTYEVLSPLGRLTALMEMTDHQFLTPNRQVELTRFGTDVEIVANFGRAEFQWRDARIPPYGFLVTSPSLVAFCALEYGQVAYTQPTMFVVWARDGQSIDTSRDVRIYHGFGDKQIRFRNELKTVETAEVIAQ